VTRKGDFLADQPRTEGEEIPLDFWHLTILRIRLRTQIVYFCGDLNVALKYL
jgi:hypothetical protein